jgi:hypothetical protein
LRNRIALVTIIVISVLSCKQQSKDADHLPSKKMEQVLLDVHLAESYSALAIDSLHKAGEKNTDTLAAYYKTIFTHHGVTAEQFSQSLAWYKRHPEELDSIYEHMLPEITKMQARTQPGSPAPPPPPPANPAEKK